MIFEANFICFLLASVYKSRKINLNYYFVKEMHKIVCDSMLLYTTGFSGKLCKQSVRVVSNLYMQSFCLSRRFYENYLHMSVRVIIVNCGRISYNTFFCYEMGMYMLYNYVYYVPYVYCIYIYIVDAVYMYFFFLTNSPRNFKNTIEFHPKIPSSSDYLQLSSFNLLPSFYLK